MYNRDRRISSILSHLDDLSDIDTRAADELRAVHHEHSITSFLEGLIPPNEEIHGCNSPLAHENIGKSRAVETTPDPAPSQQQTIAKDAPTPKAPILSAPQPGKRRRRGTWENGTTMRRPRELDNPPPSPISESRSSTRAVHEFAPSIAMADFRFKSPCSSATAPTSRRHPR